MKIPEQMFVVINAIVRLVLRSPLHGIMSNSFLLISHTGRKSGRVFTTPVRYMRTEHGVRVYTAQHTQWWRNVQAHPDVTLLVAGESSPYIACVYDRDPARNRELLIEFLGLYPQDAAYQDIRINEDGTLNQHDLELAAQKAIVVEFSKVRQ